MRLPLFVLTLAMLLVACGDDSSDSGTPDSGTITADTSGNDTSETDTAEPDTGEPVEAGLVEAPADSEGPLPVSRAYFEVESEGRTLPVELWYPTDREPDYVEPVWSAFLQGDDAETYRQLLNQERARCATQSTIVPRDLPVVRTELPLIVMSHCHTCTRFNMMTIAEYLASHGFVVAAPDHVDNTLFDELRGEAVDFNTEFLVVRGADLEAVVDALLDGALEGAVADVASAIDRNAIGVLGHSFGAVTAGWALENDDRMVAGVAVAAPMENPLLAGVTLANISQPTMHVVAVEDNSITEIGNNFIRDNYNAIATPTYKVEVADAGHWSFSDLAGVTEFFDPGCGDGQRQTNGQDFTYMEPPEAVPILATYTTAFFRAHLADDADALAALTAAPSDARTDAEARP